MNSSYKRRHSVDVLFSLLLFGLFLLFLLLMILFSAEAYETAVKGNEENNNLYTAASYVTVKFHRHDAQNSISIRDINGTEALCMSDTINGQEYITYLYLLNGQLKELLTAAELTPSFEMGTSIAALTQFRAEKLPEGYYKIIMEDEDAHRSSLLLHPGCPTN